MPIYLCQPGTGVEQPWRHGIQVYSAPFDMDSDTAASKTAAAPSAAENPRQLGTQTEDTSEWNARNDRTQQQRNDSRTRSQLTGESPDPNFTEHDGDRPNSPTERGSASIALRRHAEPGGLPVHRIRHPEVVLVDDVCMAFGRYWLRLRWPGSNGGFAGYIALGTTGKAEKEDSQSGPAFPHDSSRERTTHSSGTGVYATEEAVNEASIANQDMAQRPVMESTDTVDQTRHQNNNNNNNPDSYRSAFADERTDNDYPEGSLAGTPRQSGRETSAEPSDADRDVDDGLRDDSDDLQDNASTPSAEPQDSSGPVLTCLRTGIEFPSSVAMRLMPIYDDGLSPPVCSMPLPSEPVVCRICREGLHDDADDEQPQPAMENDAEERNAGTMSQSSVGSTGPDNTNDNGNAVPAGEANDGNIEDDSDIKNSNDNSLIGVTSVGLYKGPAYPQPRYNVNPSAIENPLMAPCECSGSMAFVHYLCIEQWRCRSRHPHARQGLNCETCGSSYALPPPVERPAATETENLMEAMPPHVLLALREPHIWWQIGAAIVRRRWLRPMAPVLISPIVALYCRARRLLKKKGVSRRRWACSLCRRRARWKCVRCLRSYYCSRQCQNVSWHIVHKHVCYKSSRFWWSVAVYGIATVLVVPGILRDPLMHDLALVMIPISFYIMALLGGGIATVLKKTRGIDLRGRTFELVTVIATSWLVRICWGLIGGFFGNSESCHGMLGSVSLPRAALSSSVLCPLRMLLLKPAEKYFLMWDRIAQQFGPRIRKALCFRPIEDSSGCFEHLPNGNADFFVEEFGGEKCAADLYLVCTVWIAAGLAAGVSHGVKRRERQRRALRRPVNPRPHQD